MKNKNLIPEKPCNKHIVMPCKCDGYGLNEVHILNQNSKTWNADDYLAGYCNLGNKNYRNEMKEETRIISNKTVKAKNERKCCRCGWQIAKHAEYTYVTFRHDGEIMHASFCQLCNALYLA